VHELQESITSAHFAELIAEELIEPRGEKRHDLRMGISAALLANCHRGKKVDPFKPVDFIPKFGEPQKPKKFNPQFLAQQMFMLGARAKTIPVKETK
jgi:hypothetical protein